MDLILWSINAGIHIFLGVLSSGSAGSISGEILEKFWGNWVQGLLECPSSPFSSGPRHFLCPLERVEVSVVVYLYGHGRSCARIYGILSVLLLPYICVHQISSGCL